MPRTTLGRGKHVDVDLGNDLEATLRAIKAAKRAEKKRQREEEEEEEVDTSAPVVPDAFDPPAFAQQMIDTGQDSSAEAAEAPVTEAIPDQATVAVKRVLDASNEFEVLNIPVRPATTAPAVRKAYRAVSLSVHPDKVRHPQANLAFQKVKEAMEVLVNGTRQEQRRVQIETAAGPAAAVQELDEEEEPVSEAAVETDAVDQANQEAAAAVEDGAEEKAATDTEPKDEEEEDEEEEKEEDEEGEAAPMEAGGEAQDAANAGDTVPASPVEVDAAELIRWEYEGAREDLHGEFKAPVGSEVVDDVFGKAKLLDVRHGKLLLHLSDGRQKCRTTGHVYIAPGEGEEEGEEEGEAAGEEEREEERKEEREEEPQLILYTVSKPKDGKRAILHVFDAKNDPANLSSRVVKRVKWVENVPSSIIGKEYDGANKACCALRGALDSSKKSLGNNGINFKVFLCVNAEGKAVMVKEVLDKKQLAKYLK